MNAVRWAEAGNQLFSSLRIKIPLIIGIFFLFNLCVERVEWDTANPDVEVLVNNASVRYLNYDFRITAQPSLITVNVKASLEVTARNTRMIYFVISNIYHVQIKDVKVNTYPADYAGEGGLFRIELPFWYQKGTHLDLELTYTLENKIHSRQVIAELAANWYPKNLLPEPVTARFQLDVPDAYTGVANGELYDVQRLSGQMKRFSWLLTRPSTSLGISIGNYQLLAREINGRYFRLFFLPGLNRTIQEAVLERAAQLSEFYYFKFGGQNVTNLTVVFSDTVWEETSFGTLIFLRYQANYTATDRENLFFNLAHELAHYWWGNQVIPKRLGDWWLVEGFANYSVLLAAQLLESAPHNLHPDELLKSWLNQYQQTKVNLSYYKMAELSLAEIGPFDLQRELLYTKGAYVLQMIRTQLGAANFDWYIGEFVKHYRHKPAGIDDLARLGAELFGAELVDFFRQWVYSTGSYNLALRDLELIKIGNRYRVTVTVANTGHLYLPNLVDLEIITKQQVYHETLRLAELNVKMQKVLPEQPLRVIINGQSRILETNLADNVLEIN